MVRPATLIALVLGFLTAFAVGQIGMLVSNQGARTDPVYAEIPDADEIVRGFYDGIGDWITSGDRSLDSMVAPNFIDHTMAGAPARDRNAFFSNLTSIRAAVSNLRLEVTHIEATGAIVTVDLTGSPGSIASIPGWSLALPEQSVSREILRIEGHRIAERWHMSDLWPYGFWSTDVSLAVGAEQLRKPSIQEFELDPETEADLIVSGTVVVMVESGSLHVGQSGHDLAGQEQPAYLPVGKGEVRILETARTLQVRSPAGNKTRFWTVSLDQVLPPRLPPDAPASAHPLGIRQTANISVAIQVPDNGSLSVCGVTLPSGTELSSYGSGMRSAGIIGGELQIVSDAGTVYYSLDSTRFRAVAGGEVATAGQGFAAQTGGSATYRVTGEAPATLILLTIAPEAAPSIQPIRTGPG